MTSFSRLIKFIHLSDVMQQLFKEIGGVRSKKRKKKKKHTHVANRILKPAQNLKLSTIVVYNQTTQQVRNLIQNHKVSLNPVWGRSIPPPPLPTPSVDPREKRRRTEKIKDRRKSEKLIIFSHITSHRKSLGRGERRSQNAVAFCVVRAAKRLWI